MHDGHEVLTLRSDVPSDVAREIDFSLPRQRETHALRQFRPVSAGLRGEVREGDAGQFLGGPPQAPRDLGVLRLGRAADQFRRPAPLQETAGARLAAARNIRDGGVERRQGAVVVALREQAGGRPLDQMAHAVAAIGSQQVGGRHAGVRRGREHGRTGAGQPALEFGGEQQVGEFGLCVRRHRPVRLAFPVQVTEVDRAHLVAAGRDRDDPSPDPRQVADVPAPTEDRPYHHGNLRAALLDAAERDLRERGDDQLTLRELARQIGVSHAAPRRHFPDRQALLDELAERGFARLDAALRTALSEAGTDFPARVRATVAAYIRFATENDALLELMYTSKHRPGATRIVEAAEAPFGLMNELITDGQALGELRAGDPERIGIVLFATVQGIASIINGNFVEPRLLDGLVDAMVEQFLRGNRPPEQGS